MRRRQSQGGFVLLMALIVIAGLLALMTMLIADQRANAQQVQNTLRQRRAEAAAQSALASSLAVLQGVNTNSVTLNDSWAQLGSAGDQEFDLDDGSTYRMQVLDAGSLVNVNTATQAQLQNLPLTQEQIDCLLDWRSTGTTALADGAKDPYYNSLSQPYNAKLGPLSTVNELLLVRNWTTQTLYQPPTTTAISGLAVAQDLNGNALPLANMLTVDSGSPNTQADGSARINFSVRGINPGTLTRAGINPRLAAQIASRAPYTSFQALLTQPGINTNTAQQLLNVATFTTNTRIEGKINLNTATQAVLQTIPNVTTTTASSLVALQSSGLTSLGQLATVSSMTPALMAQIADSVTVGSDTWIVRAYGQSGGVGTAIEAVVGIRNNQPQVITWNRLNTAIVPAWWNWNTETTSTVQASQLAMTQLGTTSTSTGVSQ